MDEKAGDSNRRRGPTPWALRPTMGSTVALSAALTDVAHGAAPEHSAGGQWLQLWSLRVLQAAVPWSDKCSPLMANTCDAA